MAIAAVTLGIISLVILLILRTPQIFIPGILKLAIVSSASVVGLILGIVALAKSEPNKPVAVAGIVMCSLVIIFSALLWIIVFGGD